MVVGYAAETHDVVGNAQKKLLAKNADFVVANDVREGRAFGADVNEVLFVDAEGVEELPLMTKERLADAVLNKALQYLR